MKQSQHDSDILHLCDWLASDIGPGTVVVVISLIFTWLYLLYDCLVLRDGGLVIIEGKQGLLLGAFAVSSTIALMIIDRSFTKVTWHKERKELRITKLLSPSVRVLPQKELFGLVLDYKTMSEGGRYHYRTVHYNRLLVITSKGETIVVSDWTTEAERFSLGQRAVRWAAMMDCTWFGGGDQRLPIIGRDSAAGLPTVEFVEYGVFKSLFRTKEGRYYILVTVLMVAAICGWLQFASSP